MSSRRRAGTSRSTTGCSPATSGRSCRSSTAAAWFAGSRDFLLFDASATTGPCARTSSPTRTSGRAASGRSSSTTTGTPRRRAGSASRSGSPRPIRRPASARSGGGRWATDSASGSAGRTSRDSRARSSGPVRRSHGLEYLWPADATSSPAGSGSTSAPTTTGSTSTGATVARRRRTLGAAARLTRRTRRPVARRRAARPRACPGPRGAGGRARRRGARPPPRRSSRRSVRRPALDGARRTPRSPRRSGPGCAAVDGMVVRAIRQTAAAFRARAAIEPLGRLGDAGDTRETARAWFSELRLGPALVRTFGAGAPTPVGSDPSTRSGPPTARGCCSASPGRVSSRRATGPPRLHLAEAWLADPGVAAYLDVHETDGVRWLSAERLDRDRRLGARPRRSRCSAATIPAPVCARDGHRGQRRSSRSAGRRARPAIASTSGSGSSLRETGAGARDDEDREGRSEARREGRRAEYAERRRRRPQGRRTVPRRAGGAGPDTARPPDLGWSAASGCRVAGRATAPFRRLIRSPVPWDRGPRHGPKIGSLAGSGLY